MAESLTDVWICQRCLALVQEGELGAHGADGPGHDIGDDSPIYCGPCVPMDGDELRPLLEELYHLRWEQRQAAKRPTEPDRRKIERIPAIVFAPGTVIKPSEFGRGQVVVINGLSNDDACASSAEACFDRILDEEDRRGTQSVTQSSSETQTAPESAEGVTLR